jgi:predicted RNase H-like nuclease (RuvC/YqgF family)
MSDNGEYDSSPEMQDKKWNQEMTGVFAEINRLREALEEKDKEIVKLQRETHKLKVCCLNDVIIKITIYIVL